MTQDEKIQHARREIEYPDFWHRLEETETYLKEIFQAIEEERFIILPCKFGEQLYSVRTAVNSNKYRLGKATTLSTENLGYVLRQFNKTMFLREEAEKKVKELNEEDNR